MIRNQLESETPRFATKSPGGNAAFRNVAFRNTRTATPRVANNARSPLSSAAFCKPRRLSGSLRPRTRPPRGSPRLSPRAAPAACAASTRHSPPTPQVRPPALCNRCKRSATARTPGFAAPTLAAFFRLRASCLGGRRGVQVRGQGGKSKVWGVVFAQASASRGEASSRLAAASAKSGKRRLSLSRSPGKLALVLTTPRFIKVVYSGFPSRRVSRCSDLWCRATWPIVTRVTPGSRRGRRFPAWILT